MIVSREPTVARLWGRIATMVLSACGAGKWCSFSSVHGSKDFFQQAAGLAERIFTNRTFFLRHHQK